ncbi:MAG: ribonuclease HI family protein [Terracidiphilus sp.]
MAGNLFDDQPSRAGDGRDGWITAHCDGGSRGNPGPAGFGAVIMAPDGRVLERLSRFLGNQTNNFAEYSGLLGVLKWSMEHGHRRLRVVSDSELMVQQMKGRYKVASPLLRPLWEEARSLARKLEGFEIAHTLRGGNKEADRLANEAMDKGMGKNRDRGTEGPRDQEYKGQGIRKQGGPQLARSRQAAANTPKQPRQVLEG